MPSNEPYATVTGFGSAPNSVSVKVAGVVPALPSVTDTSLTVIVGSTGGGVESSLRIVPWPCPSAIVALVGPLRLTKNVSSGSTAVSPTTGTLTVPLVWPAGMVRSPLVAR